MLNQKSSNLSLQRNSLELESKAYKEVKHEMLKILHDHEISVEHLFDIPRILNILNEDVERYIKFIKEINIDSSKIETELKMLELGRIVELPEELRAILDKNNIYYEFGYEWLKNSVEDKKTKLRIIRNNPFIPYSIILSSKNIDELKELSEEILNHFQYL